MNPILARALKHPKLALLELERLRCEDSLYEFVKSAWHTLHPGTPFIGGWAIETMCHHLEAVTRGEVQKLLINVPPGCTKSMLVNVFWPAWEWGPKGLAHYQYISASYEKGLSTRDLMYCRDLLKSEWYQRNWPLEFKADSDGKQEYANEKRGWRYATSVGAGLTGRRGHRFIIDDPHSVGLAESDTERETARFWFSETTPTRFVDQKKPVYVIIMQRLHETDISGVVINKLADDGWVHLCLPMEHAGPEVDDDTGDRIYRSWTPVRNPGTRGKRMRRVKKDGDPIPYFVPDPKGEMLWPQDQRTKSGELLWEERFDRDSIESLKLQLSAEGGSYAVACQLQQRPVPRGGGMFQKDDFFYLDQAPKMSDIAEICRGWDLAATKKNKAAFTVGLKLCRLFDGRYVILDVDRFRGSAREVENRVKADAEADGHGCPVSIPQDPGQAGKAQKGGFAALLDGYVCHFSPETGSKENRALPLSAQCEAGNLGMVRAPWNDAFVAEACMFPASEFKDQIDAASAAANKLMRGKTRVGSIPK